MKTPKHLVLDEDVHRALRRKKSETGLTVKDLGNCALRSVLDRPTLVEAIGEKLIADGVLKEEQFEAIRAEAIRQVCTSGEDVGSLVRSTSRHSVASGSWEIKEVANDSEGTYQVLSAWVKDHRMRPIKMHKHVGAEFLILLTGSILVGMNAESRVVTAPDTVTIPARVSHSVAPLERKTKMIAVISPPESGYRVEEPS
jgi:mannose-6-phosphate isomerase-like protein (cupin superfamily)